MAETERFQFAGMTVKTEAKVIDGQATFVIECSPEGAPEGEDVPTVYVAWSGTFDRFGVFVNDELTYPTSPEGDE